MNTNKLLILFIFCIVNACSNKKDCDSLPDSFSDYNVAIKTVEHTDFTFSESKKTPESSFIDKISYYSCDSQNGYLIVEIDNQPYIYEDISIETWEAFKNADSYGKFYTRNIKLQ